MALTERVYSIFIRVGKSQLHGGRLVHRGIVVVPLVERIRVLDDHGIAAGIEDRLPVGAKIGLDQSCLDPAGGHQVEVRAWFGILLDAEFRIPDYPRRPEKISAGVDGSGNFLIAWTSDGQDGDSNGVFARQFVLGQMAEEIDFGGIDVQPQITAFGLSSTHGDWEAGTIDSSEWADTTICWDRINKFVADFDEPVTATINDIELLDPDGQPVAIENLTGSGTAQLTFELAEDQGQAQYLTRGDYTLTLFDTIKDSYENILDGESAGPGDFPSGDGSPGGDWTFTLTALPGDANGDKQVGKLDEQIVLDHWNQTVTPGDRLSGDLTGDGYVNLDDWVVVTNNMGGNLVAPRVEAFGLSSTKPTWQAGTQDSSVWTSDRSGRTAPWNTIDKLVIEFSEPVYASLEHISMTGASSGEITLDLQGSGTATLTLTVSSGYLDNDRYELILLDGIQDVDDGNALDGEPHGDEFPSGDGVAGGDWQFDLNVLKGDASLGSTNFVGQYDLDRVLDKWGQNVTPGNFLLGDLSGDGFVGQYDRGWRNVSSVARIGNGLGWRGRWGA